VLVLAAYTVKLRRIMYLYVRKIAKITVQQLNTAQLLAQMYAAVHYISAILHDTDSTILPILQELSSGD